MTINVIIDQNDETLAYLDVNDYSNAMESASRALAYLADANSSRTLFSVEANGGIESPPLSSIIESLDECMLLQLQVEEHYQANSTETNFIYKQGIPIPPAVSRDTAILTSILIFNSALAHHLAAETPHIATTRETIYKAKQLYVLASNIERVTESACFQFAVVNNMAVLERKLGNVALSNEYFDYLAAIAAGRDQEA